MLEKVTNYLVSSNSGSQERTNSDEIRFDRAKKLLKESEDMTLEINGERINTDFPVDNLEKIHNSRENNPRFDTEIVETSRGVEGEMSTHYNAGRDYNEDLPNEFQGKIGVYVEFQADDYDQLDHIVDQAS